MIGALAMGAVIPAIAASPETFVYPNGPGEWTTSADVDGNGLLDSIIVDRVTGVYRIGYQSIGGMQTWSPPKASGVANVAGFSVGLVIDNTVPGLAFTGEEANRVNLVMADSAAAAGVPVPVYISAVGPNQVVALDIGGAGNTAWQDLWVATAQNGIVPFGATLVRNSDGSSFSAIESASSTLRFERGNRVRVRNEYAPMVGVLARGVQDTLRVLSLGSGSTLNILELTGLPAGAEYAVGQFTGDGLSQFLVFQPGSNLLQSHPVLEPVPNSLEWGEPLDIPFADAIASVVTLFGDEGSRFVVVFNEGAFASIYDFDGVNAPALVDTIIAPEGQSLLGALPLENNGFQLLAGSGTRTAQALQYSFDDGTGSYQLDHTYDLPSVSDLTGQANVFQFQMEPFVTAVPRLLNSLNAGDWSSDFALGGGPAQVSVLAERYLGAAEGLGNPSPADLGDSHPQTQFGLVNQYMDFLSLFSLSPASGNEVVEVSAQPPGGVYDTSVAVTFTVGGIFQVQYRLNESGPWSIYSGSPVPILTNTVLQYRARAVFGTAQTSIRSEHYQLAQGPDDLDSDSDGVPDYVEADQGLDPVGSGSDGDEDGYSDLEELLNGTDPNDETDHPAGPAGYEQHATVDFVVTPRPLDGVNDVETDSLTNTLVRLYDLAGSLITSTNVAMPPDVPVDAAALFRDVFLDANNELFVVATEPHYDVDTDAPDTRIGRELVGLIPSPQVAPVMVDYEFGSAGGVVADEAAAWIAAAQAAYGAAGQETQFHSINLLDTHVAALLENKLRVVLMEDAVAPVTNVTLFPFRPLDAGRPVFDADAKAALAHGDANRPAYDATQMLHSLEAMVKSAPTAEVQSLNEVAHEIYRVSSALNNDAPGVYRLPLDVLREFLRNGTLDTNYLAGGAFPPALLAEAQVGVQFLMDNLSSRPVTNLALRVRADSFAGPCTVLETDDPAMTLVNLFDLQGAAYDFPDTFQLLPGSIVQVVGRPDVSTVSCGGLGVEVLGISLSAVPASSDGDADGNLLIDTWEKLFLGMLGSDPFGDSDGDGYSDLQEMFEGTDPLDGQGVPPAGMAMLQLPSLIIETSLGGDVQLEWFWPEAYADEVEVSVLSTFDLNVEPVKQPIIPVHQGGGIWTATLPNPGTEQHYYSIVLQLH